MAESMAELFFVRTITEADFGCEGRTEQDRDTVSVCLVSGLGKSVWVPESDGSLYQEDIREGDLVSLQNTHLVRRFHLREVLPEDAEQVCRIEKICFPPNEACSEKSMKERVSRAADAFLVAEDRTGTRESNPSFGQIAGFINGIVTEEQKFRDEFFTDITLHHPAEENVMICGVDVLPAYRNQGLASAMMRGYLTMNRKKSRKKLVLTNLDRLTGFYQKMGFRDLGMANSAWGGEAWHEMERDVRE